MSMQTDKLVVVDLEATCWKKHPPSGQQNEIIEVGVCLLDVSTLEIEDNRGILVKPTRSKVSEFCTKLTSLTQEVVDGGVSFAEACITLETDYDSKNRIWLSWGAYDLRLFRSQCQSFAVTYPYSDHHVDLKGVFAKLRNKGKRVGMARALKMLEINLDGRHHRGSDDAYNTAKILVHLYRSEGAEAMQQLLQEAKST
jgi:inhibitor of KinA sporulation pathway (predicted exonuclease)